MTQAVQEAVAQGHSIHSSCQAFGLPRASYYRYAALPEAAEMDDPLRPQVQQVALDWSCYGYRRVTHELKRQGVQANHKRVLRLMREENLVRRPKKRFVATTNSDHRLPVSPKQRPPFARVPEPCGGHGCDRARPALGLRSDVHSSGPRLHLFGCGSRCLLAPLFRLVTGPTFRGVIGNFCPEDGAHRAQARSASFGSRRSICVRRVHKFAEPKRRCHQHEP